MQSLIPADQLIAEGEARHEAALLQPEDGTEAAAEEDAFNCSVGHQALSKGVRAAHRDRQRHTVVSSQTCEPPAVVVQALAKRPTAFAAGMCQLARVGRLLQC